MARRLGSIQRQVLRVMSEHGGIWHRWCMWTWNGEGSTTRLMESLERRGLLVREEFETGMGTVTGFRIKAAHQKLLNEIFAPRTK